MTNKSILVATTTNNCNIFTGFNISLLKLEKECFKREVGYRHAYTLNETFPQKAKNMLCDVFMKSQCSHLLLVDSDIEFETDDIFEMLEFNQPVVGGLYNARTIRWDKIVELARQRGHKNYTGKDMQMLSREYNFTPKDNDTANVDFTKDFLEVDAVGSGIMLIQREALEKMQNVHGRFFDTDTDSSSGIFIEDGAWFCKKWRDLGGKVYLYTKCQSKHWGSYAF